MLIRQKTLAEVVGKEAFKRLLGMKVLNSEGKYVGYLKRVYLDKKSGKAKRLIVKIIDGNFLVLNPSDAILDSNQIIIKNNIKVNTKYVFNEIVKMETSVSELRGIREKILELDEAFIAGELSRDTYICFRRALDQKRRQILAEVKGLVEDLEIHMHKLEEERDSLLRQINGHHKDDNAELLRKLRNVREALMRIYELVESARHELSLEMDLEEFLERFLQTV